MFRTEPLLESEFSSHGPHPADTYCVDNVQKKPGPGKDYDGYSYNEGTTAVASGA